MLSCPLKDSYKIDDVIEEIKKYDFIEKRNNKKYVSFTDFYKEIPNFSSKNTQTYSSFAFNKWSKYKDEVLRCASEYEYCCFLDLENFYSNIYIHFLMCYPFRDITEFKEFEQMTKKQREARMRKDYPLIFELHKKILNDITYQNQTKGLPIGNGVSDFLSEMMLQSAEYFLEQQLKWCQYKFVRYRDDIFIFSNNKNTVRLVYEAIRKIFLEMKLFINNSKVRFSDDIFQTLEIVRSRVYIDEENYKSKLLMVDTLYSINTFAIQYPKSNKIISMLKKLYNKIEEYNSDDIFRKLAELYNTSKTCVMPMICAIIDKIFTNNKNISKANLTNNFTSRINFIQMTYSDIIWINVLFKKHNFQCRQLNDINNQNPSDIKALIEHIKITPETDLYKDADTFFYE